MERRLERSSETWWRRIRPVALTLVAAALPGLGVAVLAWYGAAVADWLAATPLPLGVGLIVVAGALLCGAALMPTHALSLVAGWLLGAWLGPAVAWVSVMIAAMVSFAGGRLLGGEGLVEGFRTSPRWAPVHEALAVASPGRTAMLVALLRLSPLAPFAATNVALAAVGVRWPAFMIGSAIGLTPRIAAVAMLGAGMSELDLTRPAHAGLLGLGIAATVFALIVIGRLAQRTLQSAIATPQAT